MDTEFKWKGREGMGKWEMDVWNRGRHIIYCDNQRSGRMEPKLNIICSDIIVAARCIADARVLEEVITHMSFVRFELPIHPSYRRTMSLVSYCTVSIKPPTATRVGRFPSPSRSCFCILTYQASDTRASFERPAALGDTGK